MFGTLPTCFALTNLTILHYILIHSHWQILPGLMTQRHLSITISMRRYSKGLEVKIKICLSVSCRLFYCHSFFINLQMVINYSLSTERRKSSIPDNKNYNRSKLTGNCREDSSEIDTGWGKDPKKLTYHLLSSTLSIMQELFSISVLLYRKKLLSVINAKQ